MNLRLIPSRVSRWARGSFTIARLTLAETVRDRITTIAGSLAFHWFLAIFPAAVALIGFAGVFGLSPAALHSILHGVSALMPSQTSQILSQALQHRTPKEASQLEIVFGVLVALWSATEAMAALQIGLDVAFEVDRSRGYLGRRAMAIPLLGATLLLGASASALLVLGDPIRSLLPANFALVKPAATVGWDLLRWGGALVLVMLLLSVYYSIGPRRARRRWRFVTPGSVVAMLGWLGASAAFSFYLRAFGHESRTYGAFADVAVLLLWLYLTGLAVLIGAEVNCEVERLEVASGAPAP